MQSSEIDWHNNHLLPKSISTNRLALGESLEDKRSAEEAALSALNITWEEGGEKADGYFWVHCGVPGDESLHVERLESWERRVKMLTNA